ncbi:hypothetical protein HPB52_008270 [Rhipicephalus sanguineus]|uniref:Ionotropic glutamate receptor C-terminal domain-containing protein n=1 Tax=Rhipicephalus sanguineus TaxID=34632 RepID=A0A9D4Q691_RHISA|nr:hypothetical protein HPB52_008270 [Rhipicephalus sanguineus]
MCRKARLRISNIDDQSCAKGICYSGAGAAIVLRDSGGGTAVEATGSGAAAIDTTTTSVVAATEVVAQGARDQIFTVTYDPTRSFGTRLDNGTYTGIIGLLQKGAWTAIVASVPLMSALLAYAERRRRRNKENIFREAYDNTWDILASFAYKGHTTNTNSYAGRILLVFWWLAVFVLTNEFAGHLMASIAIKREPPRYRSVEDVAYQSSIRPLIWKDTAFDAYVRVCTKDA